MEPWTRAAFACEHLGRSTERCSTHSRVGRDCRRDSNVIDLSRPYHAERTVPQALVSLAGAAGIALLVPLAILIVGTADRARGSRTAERLVWLVPALC